MFASKVQKEIVVQGKSVLIQKLSGRSLEKCSEARQISVAQGMKAMGGDVMRAIRQMDTTGAPAAEPDYAAATKARYAAYDRTAVLLAGIKRWEDDAVIELKTVEDLEEDFAQETHEAILDLSLPPLDPEKFKAQQGKDSGLSTSS